MAVSWKLLQNNLKKHKNKKNRNRTSKEIAVFIPKFEHCAFITEKCLQSTDDMTKSLDTDQTEGAVWSGSTVFTQTWLSEYKGS